VVLSFQVIAAAIAANVVKPDERVGGSRKYATEIEAHEVLEENETEEYES
jgi:hypothetical protein